MTLVRTVPIEAAPPPGPLPLARRLVVPPEAADGPDWDIVEEWGLQSFPASDPPANW